MNKSVVLSPRTLTFPYAVHNSAKEVENDQVDLHSILAFLRRRWPIILVCVVLALVVGVIVTKNQTPTYISTAQITIEDALEEVAPLSEQDRFNAKSRSNETYIDTQVEVITSAKNIAEVVDRLGMAKDPRFVEGARSPQEARSLAIEYVENGVNAYRPAATLTIHVSFESEDSEEAARIANAFAEQYTSGNLADKETNDGKALAELKERMEAARLQAIGDAQTLAQYRISHNLPNTTDRSLTEQEISSYNQQVTDAKAQAAEDAARLATAREQLKSGSNGEDLGESLGSGVIASLRQQQAAYAAEIASLSSKYGPRHPDLIRAQTQHNAVSLEIDREIRRIVSNLSAKAEVSQKRLSSLTASLNASQGTLRRDNIAMVPLQDIEQRAQASKALYESYLSRYKELAARMGMRQAEASILHPAFASSSPASPNVMLNMILALAVGLALGLGMSIILELMFKGIASGEELERRFGLPHLASIPELGSVLASGTHRQPTDSIVEHPRSAFAEAFRSLRTSIALTVDHPKVIAISSALPGEGKTVTATCLARSMAASSDRILLIDADVRKRTVSDWIGGERSYGLLEVLRGDCTLAEALVMDARSGLVVLPLSLSPEEDYDLLTGDAMDQLLATVSKLYDAVIIDTAPVLPIADTRLLLCKADAAVIVARWHNTPSNALKAMLRMLPTDQVVLAGCVLTRLNMRKQAAFGGGEAAFYKKYSGYYAG